MIRALATATLFLALSSYGAFAQKAPGNNAKWSGVWSWVRPLAFNFGSGSPPPPPGPQDATVRKRENATLELMPNNRAKICVASNPCSIYPFSFGNGAYNIDSGSGFIAVVTNDQGRTLNGQMWFKKENRTRTTPDATFVLTDASAAPPKPAQRNNDKWSGVWSWVRPLVFNFSGGSPPPPPGPQDVTVRKRVNAVLELMPNNRAKICVDSNPCGVYPFSFGNGAYNIDYSSGFISVVTNDQGRSLNGQMWFKKENRTRTTPDATFVLRQ